MFIKAAVENRLSVLFFFCETYDRADLSSRIFSPSIAVLVGVQVNLSITLHSKKLFLPRIPLSSWYVHSQLTTNGMF